MFLQALHGQLIALLYQLRHGGDDFLSCRAAVEGGAGKCCPLHPAGSSISSQAGRRGRVAAAFGHSGIIANPNCTTILLTVALAPLAALCRRQGHWLHVDGAIGAIAALSPTHRARLDGLLRRLTAEPHRSPDTGPSPRD